MCSRKKQLVQDLIPPPSIYIHMCTLYAYTNIRMPRFSPPGFIGPSRCLIPTPRLTSEYPICAVCVCVCVYTHISPHTLSPALKIEKTQTTHPYLSCIKNILPCQATSALIDQLNPPILVPQRWLNKLHIHERIWTPCSERVRKCMRWCHNTCLTYTPAWCWLLLLLSTVVQYPWLRVYVLQIHRNLSFRVF